MSNIHTDPSPAPVKPENSAVDARRPSTKTVVFLGIALLLLAAVGFAAGFLPKARLEAQVASESRSAAGALPVVNVAPVRHGATESEIRLPANIQAITEAPILARTDGYLKTRYVDIGDHVTAGQVLAEIDAPEIEQQASQAAAAVQQARAMLEQAKAATDQARTNETLARVTAERWANLLLQGAVSRQEHDVYQAQYQAQASHVQALEGGRVAAENQLAAMQANYQRLLELKAYRQVRAPFSGVVTMRNVDTGALIAAGQTLLFRVAQDGSVRAYVNVPQQYEQHVRAGQLARLEVADKPDRVFEGRVVRTADALDPASRTLLVEIQIPNRDSVLRAGMYGQVVLRVSRETPPLLIPANAVIIGAEGSQVAITRRDGAVELRRVTLGRDYGREIEVLKGLSEGEAVIVNPGDTVRNGVRVRPKLIAQKGN